MKRFADIRVVTFDVGGTLIEVWPSVGHVYAEVAAKHGAKDLSPAELTRRFVAAFRARKQSIHTAAQWAEIVDDVFAGFVAEPPSQTFFPELYERFTQAGAWRIYEDVKPAFAALAARGLRLSVVSNWDDRLRPLLTALGLTRSFEVIVVSCEVGSAKPEPAIFLEPAKRLGVPPSAVLHVGDSFEIDVQGARAAGMNAVQILRASQPMQTGQINSLHELVPLV